jgi:tetratricopeptide (TPR) repeat protein
LEETQPPIETEAAAGQEVDFSAIAHQESDTAQPYVDTGGLNEPSELDRTTTPIAPPPPSQEQEEAKEQMAQTEQPRPGEGFEKADLVQVLNSIDFQLDFGNPIEAKMEIERALLIFQDSQELMNRLEITEERLKMCQPTVSAAEPNEKDFASSIDLPKMLDSRLNPAKSAEELNDDIKVADRLQTAEELFNAFRDEVAAKVDGNDYDTHYDLGIAYKEMMLPDPAIEEFKKAMANPERTIECCSMLALCERMKGDLKAATNWLLIGIVAPGFPPIDSRGLRLDLAALLKERGSHGESEALFQEIKDLDNALGIDWA